MPPPGHRRVRARGCHPGHLRLFRLVEEVGRVRRLELRSAVRIAAAALRWLPPVALIEHDLRILGHGEHSAAHATRIEAEAVPRHAVRETVHPE